MNILDVLPVMPDVTCCDKIVFHDGVKNVLFFVVVV